MFSFEICKIFKNAFFHKTPLVAASVILTTICSVFRNLLVFKWLCVYTKFFYWTRYHWKFEQAAEAVSCKKFAISLQLYQKETPAQLFSCTFCESFAPKVASQWRFFFWIVLTQLTFTYFKSTTETLEKGVKYVQG